MGSKYILNDIHTARYLTPEIPWPSGMNNCTPSVCPSRQRGSYCLLDNGDVYVTAIDGCVYYLNSSRGNTAPNMVRVYPTSYEGTYDGKKILATRAGRAYVYPWEPATSECNVSLNRDEVSEKVIPGPNYLANPKVVGVMELPFAYGYYCIQSGLNTCAVFYHGKLIYEGKYHGMGTPAKFTYGIWYCDSDGCCPYEGNVTWSKSEFQKWETKKSGNKNLLIGKSVWDTLIDAMNVNSDGQIKGGIIVSPAKEGKTPTIKSLVLDDTKQVDLVVGETNHGGYGVYNLDRSKLLGVATVSSAGKITSYHGENSANMVGSRVLWSFRRGTYWASPESYEQVGSVLYGCDYEFLYTLMEKERSSTCDGQLKARPKFKTWYSSGGFLATSSGQNGCDSSVSVSQLVGGKADTVQTTPNYTLSWSGEGNTRNAHCDMDALSSGNVEARLGVSDPNINNATDVSSQFKNGGSVDITLSKTTPLSTAPIQMPITDTTKTYYLFVRMGNNGFFGDRSEWVTKRLLGIPTLSYNSSTTSLSGTGVIGADHYTVRVTHGNNDPVDYTVQPDNPTEIPLDNTKSYTITAIAVGNKADSFDSVESNAVTLSNTSLITATFPSVVETLSNYTGDAEETTEEEDNTEEDDDSVAYSGDTNKCYISKWADQCYVVPEESEDDDALPEEKIGMEGSCDPYLCGGGKNSKDCEPDRCGCCYPAIDLNCACDKDAEEPLWKYADPVEGGEETKYCEAEIATVKLDPIGGRIMPVMGGYDSVSGEQETTPWAYIYEEKSGCRTEKNYTIIGTLKKLSNDRGKKFLELLGDRLVLHAPSDKEHEECEDFNDEYVGKDENIVLRDKCSLFIPFYVTRPDYYVGPEYDLFHPTEDRPIPPYRPSKYGWVFSSATRTTVTWVKGLVSRTVALPKPQGSGWSNFGYYKSKSDFLKSENYEVNVEKVSKKNVKETHGMCWKRVMRHFGDINGPIIRCGTQINDVFYVAGETDNDARDVYYWNGYEWKESALDITEGNRITLFYKDQGGGDSVEDETCGGFKVLFNGYVGKRSYKDKFGKWQSTDDVFACGHTLAINLGQNHNYRKMVFHEDSSPVNGKVNGEDGVLRYDHKCVKVYDFGPSDREFTSGGQRMQEGVVCFDDTYTMALVNVDDNKQKLLVWFNEYSLKSSASGNDLISNVVYTTGTFSYNEAPNIFDLEDYSSNITKGMIERYAKDGEDIRKNYCFLYSRNNHYMYVFYKGSLIDKYESKSYYADSGKYSIDYRSYSGRVCGPRYAVVKLSKCDCDICANLDDSGNSDPDSEYSLIEQKREWNSDDKGGCGYYAVYRDGERIASCVNGKPDILCGVDSSGGSSRHVLVLDEYILWKASTDSNGNGTDYKVSTALLPGVSREFTWFSGGGANDFECTCVYLGTFNMKSVGIDEDGEDYVSGNVRYEFFLMGDCKGLKTPPTGQYRIVAGEHHAVTKHDITRKNPNDPKVEPDTVFSATYSLWMYNSATDSFVEKIPNVDINFNKPIIKENERVACNTYDYLVDCDVDKDVNPYYAIGPDIDIAIRKVLDDSGDIVSGNEIDTCSHVVFNKLSSSKTGTAIEYAKYSSGENVSSVVSYIYDGTSKYIKYIDGAEEKSIDTVSGHTAHNTYTCIEKSHGEAKKYFDSMGWDYTDKYRGKYSSSEHTRFAVIEEGVKSGNNTNYSYYYFTYPCAYLAFNNFTQGSIRSDSCFDGGDSAASANNTYLPRHATFALMYEDNVAQSGDTGAYKRDIHAIEAFTVIPDYENGEIEVVQVGWNSCGSVIKHCNAMSPFVQNGRRFIIGNDPANIKKCFFSYYENDSSSTITIEEDGDIKYGGIIDCDAKGRVCGNYNSKLRMIEEEDGWIDSVTLCGCSKNNPNAIPNVERTPITIGVTDGYPVGMAGVELLKRGDNLYDTYYGGWLLEDECISLTSTNAYRSFCCGIPNTTMADYAYFGNTGNLYYKGILRDTFKNVVSHVCCGCGIMLVSSNETRVYIAGRRMFDGTDLPTGFSFTCCGLDYFLLQRGGFSYNTHDIQYDSVTDSQGNYTETIRRYGKDNVLPTRPLSDGNSAWIIETKTIRRTVEEGEGTVRYSYERPTKWRAIILDKHDREVTIEFQHDYAYTILDGGDIQARRRSYIPWKIDDVSNHKAYVFYHQPAVHKDGKQVTAESVTMLSSDPRITSIECFRYENIPVNDVDVFHGIAAYSVFYEDHTNNIVDRDMYLVKGDDYEDTIWTTQFPVVQNIHPIRQSDDDCGSGKKCDCLKKAQIKNSFPNTCICVWERNKCTSDVEHKNDNPFIPFTANKDVGEDNSKVIFISDYNASARWDRESVGEAVDRWQNNHMENATGIGGFWMSAPAYNPEIHAKESDYYDKTGRLVVSGNSSLFVWDKDFGRLEYNTINGKRVNRDIK